MRHLIQRSLAAAILLFFMAPDSQAGLNTYTFSESSGTYTALTTTNILVAGVMEFPIRLPFRFRVDTVSSDSLFININGYAALRKDPNVFQTFTPQPLASNRQYDGVMSPFGTDMYPGYFGKPPEQFV